MQVRKIAYLFLGAATLFPIAARADGEPEDLHTRPSIYDDPGLTRPPSAGGAPQYPLAAAFVSADPSNYTAGGISSYQYVVVHTMQGYYGGSISWFQNPSANVSAHYCMQSADGEVTQMVHDEDRAWHVGNSNSVALGIEHEGFVDDPSWYTFATYQSSARLARWLCELHDIPVDRDHIVGHVELPDQTHTDPGPNWDWDLYMALVRDVVPPATIVGAVVDASTPCVVEVVADSWLTTTLQSADEADSADKCALDAGTQLAVQWSSDPMLGRVRLTLEDAPCPGELARQGFIDAADLDTMCTPADVGVPDATVVLGDLQLTTDAEGRFEIIDVSPGDHMLEVTAPDYEPMADVVSVAGHPGARIVIAVEPIAGPDAPDDPTTGSDSGTDPGDPPADPTDPAGGGSDGDGGSWDGEEALPEGFGADGDAGACSCRTDRRPVAWWAVLVVAGFLRPRRRRSR